MVTREKFIWENIVFMINEYFLDWFVPGEPARWHHSVAQHAQEIREQFRLAHRGRGDAWLQAGPHTSLTHLHIVSKSVRYIVLPMFSVFKVCVVVFAMMLLAFNVILLEFSLRDLNFRLYAPLGTNHYSEVDSGGHLQWRLGSREKIIDLHCWFPAFFPALGSEHVLFWTLVKGNLRRGISFRAFSQNKPLILNFWIHKSGYAPYERLYRQFFFTFC